MNKKKIKNVKSKINKVINKKVCTALQLPLDYPPTSLKFSKTTASRLYTTLTEGSRSYPLSITERNSIFDGSNVSSISRAMGRARIQASSSKRRN